MQGDLLDLSNATSFMDIWCDKQSLNNRVIDVRTSDCEH